VTSWKLRQKALKLLADEIHTVYKDHGGRLRVALAFPNTYFVGMSNLGLQVVYGLLNDRADVVCERVFMPEPEDEQAYASGRAVLATLESGTPLNAFDILAFSLCYEQDYVNVLKMLRWAGVPLSRESRGERDPFVIAGGICVFYNPEPLADFFDAFLVGEAEVLLEGFLDCWREASQAGASREELAEALCGKAGIYVPAGYEVSYAGDGTLASLEAKNGYPPAVYKQEDAGLSERPSTTQVLTPHTEFGKMFLIEANRGCARKCRFCVVGYVAADARFPSKESILSHVGDALATHERVGLVGPSVFDHPQVEEIVEEAVALGAQVSISSLRLNSLSERLLEALKASGHRTITLAPEAGSDRLRSVILKEASEEEILDKVAMVAKAGFTNLKLYIMIGLPTETDSDIEDLINLAKKCKHTMLASARRAGSLGRVTLSVNPFIPKAQTPFQWDVFYEAKLLESKIKAVRRGLGKVANVEVTYELPKWSYVQTILSVGDRRVGRLLERVVELGGDWGAALRAHPINPDFYAYRERSYEECLPWDHIVSGLSKEKLVAQRERAYALAETTPVA
jgi:radical SAM superfamily enzyme YgiQ (UPF0313 family)